MGSPIAPSEAVAMGNAIKALLLARGTIPQQQTTNEHAFEITGRLAYMLRSAGARLIKKNAAQNGAETIKGRVSHDAIAFISGGWADALVNAGPPRNENRPAWQWADGARPNPDTLVEPWDMDAALVVTPPIDVPPPPSNVRDAMQQANSIAYGFTKHNDAAYWDRYPNDPEYFWKRMLGWMAGGEDVARFGKYAVPPTPWRVAPPDVPPDVVTPPIAPPDDALTKHVAALTAKVDALMTLLSEVHTTQQRGLGGVVYGYKVRLKP